MLRGIARFAKERGGWTFHLEPGGFVDELVLPRNWTGDGAVVRLTDERLARALRSRRLPAVNVSWLRRHSKRIPKVVADEAACATMAAEHFLEKRFRHFGYVGPVRSLPYSDTVERTYVARLREAGHDCDVFRSTTSDVRPNIASLRRELTDWMRDRATPTGITVWNGEWGRLLTTVCSELGISIPHDVAVLVVEPDPLMSALSPVPLSQIDRNGERVGFVAVEWLERLMLGFPAPEEPVLVPPLRVLEAQSTDVLAVEDEIVRDALALVRRRLRGPLSVADLERELAVSRRVLEHRFQRSLGHTPAVAIRRMKLELGCDLLLTTALTIEEIAHQLGYDQTATFVRTFRNAYDTTPGRYRRANART